MAAGLLLTATGCGSDSERKAASPNTSVRSTTSTTVEPTTSTTTTTPPTPEQQVKAAYLAAMSALYRSGENPDPKDPSLAKTQTGPSLVKARQILAGFQRAGVHLEFVTGKPPVPTIDSIRFTSGTTAFATTCIVDDSRQVRASDGQVINDAVVTRSSLAELRLTSGVWLLRSQVNLLSSRDGKGCGQ